MLFAGAADDSDILVDDASVYREQRAALANNSLSFADFLRAEKLVLRADLLRPWANWVTPEGGTHPPLRHLLLRRRHSEGQRADGENTESDRAFWSTPQAALDEFAEGRSFLLPPTWSQLDSVNGRTVADVLATERRIVAMEPSLSADKAHRRLGHRVLRRRPLQRGPQPARPQGYSGSKST